MKPLALYSQAPKSRLPWNTVRSIVLGHLARVRRMPQKAQYVHTDGRIEEVTLVKGMWEFHI